MAVLQSLKSPWKRKGKKRKKMLLQHGVFSRKLLLLVQYLSASPKPRAHLAKTKTDQTTLDLHTGWRIGTVTQVGVEAKRKDKKFSGAFFFHFRTPIVHTLSSQVFKRQSSSEASNCIALLFIPCFGFELQYVNATKG